MIPIELEEKFAKKLREILATIPWIDKPIVQAATGHDSGFDLKVIIPFGLRQIVLSVICKDEIRPSQIPQMANPEKLHPKKDGVLHFPVLSANNISPRVAELCLRNNWLWFDLAGNCRITIPNLLHIEIKGNPPIKKPNHPKANLGSFHTARILRLLLAPANAGRPWTQSEITQAAYPDISAGMVNKVVRYLADENYLTYDGNRRVRAADPLSLLLAWRNAYRFKQHLRRNYFTLMPANEIMDTLAALGKEAAGRIAYASFSAAEVQAPYVRQLKLWLYLDPIHEELFRTRLAAKPVDSGENIIVLFPADLGVFYELIDTPNRLSCTNPVQTYLDVFHSGSRGEEAADAILTHLLKKAWDIEVK